jgi:hypothetical protein
VPDSREWQLMDRFHEWAALISRRNIAYVVFVSLPVPFGALIETAGPQGPDAGGGPWPR